MALNINFRQPDTNVSQIGQADIVGAAVRGRAVANSIRANEQAIRKDVMDERTALAKLPFELQQLEESIKKQIIDNKSTLAKLPNELTRAELTNDLLQMQNRRVQYELESGLMKQEVQNKLHKQQIIDQNNVFTNLEIENQAIYTTFDNDLEPNKNNWNWLKANKPFIDRLANSPRQEDKIRYKKFYEYYYPAEEVAYNLGETNLTTMKNNNGDTVNLDDPSIVINGINAMEGSESNSDEFNIGNSVFNSAVNRIDADLNAKYVRDAVNAGMKDPDSIQEFVKKAKENAEFEEKTGLSKQALDAKETQLEMFLAQNSEVIEKIFNDNPELNNILGGVVSEYGTNISKEQLTKVRKDLNAKFSDIFSDIVGDMNEQQRNIFALSLIRKQIVHEQTAHKHRVYNTTRLIKNRTERLREDPPAGEGGIGGLDLMNPPVHANFFGTLFGLESDTFGSGDTTFLGFLTKLGLGGVASEGAHRLMNLKSGARVVGSTGAKGAKILSGAAKVGRSGHGAVLIGSALLAGNAQPRNTHPYQFHIDAELDNRIEQIEFYIDKAGGTGAMTPQNPNYEMVQQLHRARRIFTQFQNKMGPMGFFQPIDDDIEKEVKVLEKSAMEAIGHGSGLFFRNTAQASKFLTKLAFDMNRIYNPQTGREYNLRILERINEYTDNAYTQSIADIDALIGNFAGVDFTDPKGAAPGQPGDAARPIKLVPPTE